MNDLTADVLVAGGGPAGAWAAIKAAEAGADVVLADKGYLGTSGATASAGTGVWYVEPDPEAREAAMAGREGLGGYLADREWMARVLDQTYANMNELAEISRYPFPVDENGRQIRRGLQGPEYMRRMRVRVRRAGVRVLDHSPVTELLADGAAPSPEPPGTTCAPTGRSGCGRARSSSRPAGAPSSAGRSAATSTPGTARCSRRRPARSCRAWSSPTPTRSPPPSRP